MNTETGQRDSGELAGRRILVTGGSSGIGRACAVELARQGARIGLVARRADQLDETLSMLTGSGHTQWSYDLLDSDGLAHAVKSWISEFGAFNGFVHAAGICDRRSLWRETPERIERVFRVNVFAAIEICGQLLLDKSMRQTTSGSVVVISSAAAFSGAKALSTYAASKGALVSWVRSAAVELAEYGWRVNSVAPGWVEGAMLDEYRRRVTLETFEDLRKTYPLGFGNASDVADAVSFLIGPRSRWITGVTIPVDGGFLS